MIDEMMKDTANMLDEREELFKRQSEQDTKKHYLPIEFENRTYTENLILLKEPFGIVGSLELSREFEDKYFAKHKQEYIQSMETGQTQPYFDQKNKTFDRFVDKKLYHFFHDDMETKIMDVQEFYD